MAKHHARLYYWLTCVREKAAVPAVVKVGSNNLSSARSNSVSSMSGYFVLIYPVK